MVKSFIRGLCVAAVLSVGAVGLSPTAASAGNLSLGIIIGGDGYDRGGRWDRGDRHRRGGGCSINRALNKARDLGVRRPYVERETRRAVVVASARNGAVVRFAQRRGCPVLSYRR